ncbi:B12-binding domain-containing radical SAM protein [Thiofilum flexile]|uniref:B12-binding domain-containing radical SAM protein n=1 Tax=Thiofilum flexile TaxID=125627 RepID=UPI00037E760E|nr:radical SAM protein [Thiofilum flexile]
MHVKMILPALQEAGSPEWRPIKYSLFPPLGLATLAAYLHPDDTVELVDQHVERLDWQDEPDLVVIQVYITNASRAYRIADHYRAKGCYVCLGGLHVTSLPEEAARHADSIFLGPGEETFPQFLADFRRGEPKVRYQSGVRTLEHLPPIRRDLIKRDKYLVPNSIVVTRGCPYHCNFCYKDAFFQGGKSFYTQRVDAALAEIERLPGRHLYFLDDHLLGDARFARALFDGMQGMRRLFQGASTVNAILKGDLIERAAEAGLRSVFIGFESLGAESLAFSNKGQNLGRDYDAVIRRLDQLGIKINGSFVFGLDGDTPEVFRRTVDWAVSRGITTATFHIATPYPGTAYYQQLKAAGRLRSDNWDLYDTRHVVFEPRGMSSAELQAGYEWAYREFYSWGNIFKASQQHVALNQRLRHFAYSAGWKKAEPIWNSLIRHGGLGLMRQILELTLDGREAAQTPITTLKTPVLQDIPCHDEAP